MDGLVTLAIALITGVILSLPAVFAHIYAKGFEADNA